MNSQPQTGVAEAVAKLEACRLFDGPPRDFWPKFAQTCAELVQAQATAVVVSIDGSWRIVAGWPQPREFPLAVAGPNFDSAARRAVADGVSSGSAGPQVPAFLLLGLAMGEGAQASVLAVVLRSGSPEEVTTAGNILRLATDTPFLYQRQQLLNRTRREVENYAQALEVLAATNTHTRFISVSMALVNEIASRFHCSRVSLGWTEGPYVRVKAISGTDHFEKRMAVVQRLEAAMEETRDQDEEIVWPAPQDATVISRDHGAYADLERIPSLLSSPVRVDGQARGTLLLERGSPPFTEADALALRVVADQVARRLDDLHKLDRWFGARWAASFRQWCAGFLGPRHTWIKAGAVAGVLLLAIATLVPVPYHVDATFIVRPETLQYIPVPFDGYLAEVAARPGDLVPAGAPLVRMATSDLKVEEASALAEQQRYAAEAEKAEADRQLSDMRVARAMEAQAGARLDLIRYRLARAEMRAPFDGIVVEGDLRERIGAPLKTGDLLMKFSQLKDLYVEMRVPERDIDQVAHSRKAQAAFASRPEDTYSVSIVRIEPSASVDKDGNAFIMRGRLDKLASWFRPGMSGIAKVDAGHRSLLWIATHRLVDFLRMKLWW
jgi:Barrel-sandwich domain of CusB or HlyD membrane-fusion/GAF domain